MTELETCQRAFRYAEKKIIRIQEQNARLKHACEQYNKALSAISLLLFEPNEHNVSPFDLHQDPSVVVERVAERLKDKGGPLCPSSDA